MVLLFWIVGGFCVSSSSALASCHGGCFGVGGGAFLLAGGGVLLDLAIGALALGLALRRQDWLAASCLGIVLLAGIVAEGVVRSVGASRLYRPVSPVWYAMTTASLLTLALLPPLTALAYGLARSRLVLALIVVALTLIALSAAGVVLIAHDQ
jgi:hypothetical protein